jgi:hypothetical protein
MYEIKCIKKIFSQKVASSNVDEAIGFFYWPNICSRAMDLRFTQAQRAMLHVRNKMY